MIPRRYLMPVIACAVGLGAARGQTPAVSDPDAVLKELAAIKISMREKHDQRLRQTAAEIRRIAQSPSDARTLYLNSIKEAQFAGLTGQAGKFSDQKERLDGAMSTPVFRTAITLHLQYLALTLDRAIEPDKPYPVDPIVGFLKESAETKLKFYEELAGNRLAAELLNNGVNQGIFERVFRFGPELNGLKDWEMSPGNIEGILEKQIRPRLREAKDPRLIETWNLQISYEGQLAEEDGKDITMRDFQDVRLPALVWRKARDMYALGQTKEALALMLDTVRAYPAHPEIGAWVDEVERNVRTVSGKGDT